MMASPGMFVDSLKNEPFERLIAERNSLLHDIKDLEKIVFQEDKTDPEWDVHPGPDVRYQMDLEYLSVLCTFMQEKFNLEVVRKGEVEA